MFRIAPSRHHLLTYLNCVVGKTEEFIRTPTPHTFWWCVPACEIVMVKSSGCVKHNRAQSARAMAIWAHLVWTVPSLISPPPARRDLVALAKEEAKKWWQTPKHWISPKHKGKLLRENSKLKRAFCMVSTILVKILQTIVRKLRKSFNYTASRNVLPKSGGRKSKRLGFEKMEKWPKPESSVA